MTASEPAPPSATAASRAAQSLLGDGARIATDEELRDLFAQLIDNDRREGISSESTADGVMAFMKLGREQVLAVREEHAEDAGVIKALRRQRDEAEAERDQLRAQLDALIAACDAEYAQPVGEQPAGIPALLDALADQMPDLSPEEELDGWKRQASWSHYMAIKFNSRLADLRVEVTRAQGAVCTCYPDPLDHEDGCLQYQPPKET